MGNKIEEQNKLERNFISSKIVYRATNPNKMRTTISRGSLKLENVW